MKVLVVGSGGREHALCWTIAASPLCDELYCAPGNAGIAEEAACVDIGAEDIGGLLAFARDNAIDFVVVGPEGPLVLSLVDRLEEAGIKVPGINVSLLAAILGAVWATYFVVMLLLLLIARKGSEPLPLPWRRA